MKKSTITYLGAAISVICFFITAIKGSALALAGTILYFRYAPIDPLKEIGEEWKVYFYFGLAILFVIIAAYLAIKAEGLIESEQ